MSPRLKRPRKVLNPPPVKGFKPYGHKDKDSNQDPVILLFEEYEALRLCDYDMFNHHKASVIMDVSRPTFTRVYASARQKIARAFVEGRRILIEGGKVYFDSDWHQCESCFCFFNNPEKDNLVERCPLCGNNNIKSLGQEILQEEDEQCDDSCICISCNSLYNHQHGMPCSQQICPKCGARMRRKHKNEKI